MRPYPNGWPCDNDPMPRRAVLGTDGDNPGDWLHAGQAPARVLLRARIDRVDASFNQPIQVGKLRPLLGWAYAVYGVRLCIWLI